MRRRRWRDARTWPELDALIKEALAEAGTVKGAAALLGISRRQLTRYRSEVRRPPCLTTDETVAREKSLTPFPHRPTVSTGPQPSRKLIAAELPEDLALWLEEEAWRRKAQGLTARCSKSRVIEDAVREYRRNVDAVRALLEGKKDGGDST